jgi:hypothetical protein
MVAIRDDPIPDELRNAILGHLSLLHRHRSVSIHDVAEELRKEVPLHTIPEADMRAFIRRVAAMSGFTLVDGDRE